MLPVLEGPGVESISATASARDSVVIDLVIPSLDRRFLIYCNTACRQKRQLTHFRALKRQMPRSFHGLNKQIKPLVSSHTPGSRSRVEQPQTLGLEA